MSHCVISRLNFHVVVCSAIAGVLLCTVPWKNGSNLLGQVLHVLFHTIWNG